MSTPTTQMSLDSLLKQGIFALKVGEGAIKFAQDQITQQKGLTEKGKVSDKEFDHSYKGIDKAYHEILTTAPVISKTLADLSALKGKLESEKQPIPPQLNDTLVKLVKLQTAYADIKGEVIDAKVDLINLLPKSERANAQYMLLKDLISNKENLHYSITLGEYCQEFKQDFKQGMPSYVSLQDINSIFLTSTEGKSTFLGAFKGTPHSYAKALAKYPDGSFTQIENLIKEAALSFSSELKEEKEIIARQTQQLEDPSLTRKHDQLKESIKTHTKRFEEIDAKQTKYLQVFGDKLSKEYGAQMEKAFIVLRERVETISRELDNPALTTEKKLHLERLLLNSQQSLNQCKHDMEAFDALCGTKLEQMGHKEYISQNTQFKDTLSELESKITAAKEKLTASPSQTTEATNANHWQGAPTKTKFARFAEKEEVAPPRNESPTPAARTQSTPEPEHFPRNRLGR